MESSSSPIVCLLGQGEEYFVKEEFARALDVFEVALVQAQQSNTPLAEAFALQRLGTIHLEQGQQALALAAVEQALAIALEQHDVQSLYNCHRQLSQIHKASQNFEAALRHLETAESIREDTLQSGVHPELIDRPPVPLLPPAGAEGAPDDWLFGGSSLFRSIVQKANIGVAIFQEGYIIYSNPCFQQWVGYQAEATSPIALQDLLSAEDYQALMGCHWHRILHEQALCHCEKQLRRRDGQTITVEFNASVIECHYRPAILTFMRNITEQKQMERSLRASEERYHSLFDHVPIGLCRFSPEGLLLDANPAMVSMFGFVNLESFLVAQPLLLDHHGQQPWQVCDNQAGLLKYCELQLSRQDGRDLWVRVQARAVTNACQEIVYYEGAVEDITEIRAAQTALEELATRDSLTHVYNRRHFFELAERELGRASRFNRPISLLMVDIDYFKVINDTHGHLVGDQVLRDVVLRLRDNLRQSDILARYGGEEFVVLMPETSQAQAWNGAERLRQVVGVSPFITAKGSIPVTLSVGVTSWMPAARSTIPKVESLINQADQALYQAKQGGRNRTQTAPAFLCSTSQVSCSQV